MYIVWSYLLTVCCLGYDRLLLLKRLNTSQLCDRDCIALRQIVFLARNLLTHHWFANDAISGRNAHVGFLITDHFSHDLSL